MRNERCANEGYEIFLTETDKETKEEVGVEEAKKEAIEEIKEEAKQEVIPEIYEDVVMNFAVTEEDVDENDYLANLG